MSEPFRQDDDITPVLFRVSRAPRREGAGDSFTVVDASR